jgi:hypothetical protein
VKVCAAEDIPLFEGRRTRIESSYVGVFHAEDGFYAIGDVCPHIGGPLSDDIVAGTEVSCPGLLQIRREMVRRTALNVSEKLASPVLGSLGSWSV